MHFKKWLLAEADKYQQVFPFLSQEDPPDSKRIKRFKSMDNYVKTMSKGGRQTEQAAKNLISAPFNSGWVGEEEILDIMPNAMTIPAHTYPGGKDRPEWNIAFVHTRQVNPIQSKDPKYDGKRRHRILAFWQGQNSTFTRKNIGQFDQPIGGVSHVAGYIDTVWVHPDYQGSSEKENYPSLYRALREFAQRRGYPGLSPDDDLTSKSFRGAQAKYDWRRAQQKDQSV